MLDATKSCCDRYGVAKVTIDDIAAASGISRATIYRLFPGGRDVIFEALRVRELEEFFEVLRADVEGAATIEDVIVRTVVGATRELRADDHLALMLAAAPGEALNQLTVEGVPRIIRFATAFLSPFVEPYVDRTTSRALIDVLARLVISYFLAPSDAVDLGDETSARSFVLPLMRPYLDPHPTHAIGG